MLISSRHWTLSVPVKGSGLITDRMNELRKKTHVTRQEWTTPVGSSNVWSVCVYVRTIICIHQEDEKCRGRRQRGRRLRAVLSECFDRNPPPPQPPLPPPPSIPSIESRSSQLSRHARNGLLQQDHSVSGVQCEYMLVCVIYQADEKCRERRRRGRTLRAVFSECFDQTRQEWTTQAGSFSEWSVCRCWYM